MAGCKVSPAVRMSREFHYKEILGNGENAGRQKQLEIYLWASAAHHKWLDSVSEKHLGVSCVEVSDVIFLVLKLTLCLGKRTSSFFDPLLSYSLGSSGRLLSQLSTPAAADFGYSLPCLFLGRKKDALLSSKATSGNQDKNTEQMGQEDGNPRARSGFLSSAESCNTQWL